MEFRMPEPGGYMTHSCRLLVSFLITASVIFTSIAAAAWAKGNRSEKFNCGDTSGKINYNRLYRTEDSPYWEKAREVVYRTPDELKAQHNREKRKGIFYDKLLHGNYSLKEVALTFDDGPHRQYTPQLLRILKAHQIRATFFIVGKLAEENPDLIRAEYQDGHEIGNHSFHHVKLTRIPRKDIIVEWLACSNAIESIIGVDVKYCRPPGGDYDDKVISTATQCGLTTVLWTDDPGDYLNPGREVIEQRVLWAIYNGGIILLHDGIQQTINMLPGMIKSLKGQGYKFVTVSEMARRNK
jgi:peptidoglycan-N-acetylglucosamine deacetylase